MNYYEWFFSLLAFDFSILNIFFLKKKILFIYLTQRAREHKQGGAAEGQADA